VTTDDTLPSVDVAIVGGGISGLAAAYELQQRGLSVRVLEASSRPGGVIQTECFGGWVIDGGPDALLAQKFTGVELCRQLGLGDRLVSTLEPRTAFVLHRGRLHALAEGSFLGFPVKFGALARTSLFSLRGKARMTCEAFMPTAGGDDESIASFVRRRFGQEAVDRLAEPLLAGIHAGAVERLSMRALFPRLLDAEQQAGSILRAARTRRVDSTSPGAFVSLPGGTGELTEALAAALSPGTLELSTRVTDIRRPGTYVVETGATARRASAVLLAVPAYVAAGLFRTFDTTLAGLCDAIPYASTATVALGYNREQVRHPLKGTGFVVPRTEHNPLLAATWVSSKWAGRAPTGSVLLRAFLGGARDPHRLDREDQDLIKIAETALADALGIDGPPLFARLARWTRQSPQHELGHPQRVAAIDAHLTAVPGLFVTGSGFRVIGIPDCIADGRAMAGRAADFLARQRRK
jgi:oxygen-dependent protoporphyrinogen oxidase